MGRGLNPTSVGLESLYPNITIQGINSLLRSLSAIRCAWRIRRALTTREEGKRWSLLAIKKKGRVLVGRGEKGRLSDPGSELRLGTEKKGNTACKDKDSRRDGQNNLKILIYRLYPQSTLNTKAVVVLRAVNLTQLVSARIVISCRVVS